MKRYKLLKDLPTFSKGDTFQLTEHGHLMSEKDGVIAYAKPTLKKFNILLDSDWFEEIPEEYKRWRADEEGTYWFVRSYGEARGATYDCMELCDSTDDYRYSIGNYFKTEAEAKKAVNWLKAFTTLRDDTKGFKPDWSDPGQGKWFVFYDHVSRRLWSGLSFTYQGEDLYFASEDEANDSIKNHRREWLTLFNVEE